MPQSCAVCSNPLLLCKCPNAQKPKSPKFRYYFISFFDDHKSFFRIGIGLGVLSLIGLGTVLHTFLIYLVSFHFITYTQAWRQGASGWGKIFKNALKVRKNDRNFKKISPHGACRHHMHSIFAINYQNFRARPSPRLHARKNYLK